MVTMQCTLTTRMLLGKKFNMIQYRPHVYFVVMKTVFYNERNRIAYITHKAQRTFPVMFMSVIGGDCDSPENVRPPVFFFFGFYCRLTPKYGPLSTWPINAPQLRNATS